MDAKVTGKTRQGKLKVQIDLDKFELSCFIELLKKQEGTAWHSLAAVLEVFEEKPKQR